MKKLTAIGVIFVPVIGTLFVIPKNVKGTPDSNNDYQEAIEVFNNDVIIETLDIADDAEDYYKIYLEIGEDVIANLYVPSGQDFDFYLHDSSYSVIDSSVIDNPGTGDYYENVNWTAGVSGWYYLNVSAFSGSGSYIMNITATAEWTFMVYISDWDLENAGIGDFLEMASAGSTAEVNILIQFDRWDGFKWDWDSGSTQTRFANWSLLGHCQHRLKYY